MKRIAVLVSIFASAATPAMAQLAGMPVWNSPKGGTGVTIAGDLAFPNSDAGKGTAFGARASLGLANISLGVGVSSWKPDGFNESTTSVAGGAAFRVIGGSLIPVSINMHLGAGTASSITSGISTLQKTTNIVAGAGMSVNVPTPGLSIEPFLDISNRWHKPSSGSTESNIGWVIGANIGFGMLGLHVAYDSEKMDSGATAGVIGIGVHFALKAPIGM